jgi:uncharacterized protein with GYD domain
MTLFVVTHRHSPERCPAGDPNKAMYLMKRLSKECTSTYGITIHAAAMADGQHSLYVILEAGDREQVERFMAPFAQGGSVAILPASACEEVIARARC